MKAEVLTIGDELLRGEIIDSNKSFLSDRLLGLDIETRFHASVLDDPEDMKDAFLRAASRSDVILVSGGLGPTRDDLTCEVLAETFGREMLLHEPSLETIRGFFKGLGREMAENNAKQAWFPRDSEILANPIGTAPGCLLTEGNAWFFCMPGVPRELYRMMDEQVMPRLAARRGDGQVVRATLLRTFGIGESDLDAELADIAASGDVSLGFRTAFPDNYLRPLTRAKTVEEADRLLARVSEAIRERLGPVVYGEGEETLPAVTARLLSEQGRSIAVAEACTGGLIAQQLTEFPLSASCFLGGVVLPESVMTTGVSGASLLGVPEVVSEHGVVSAAAARAMAESVRERFGADFGLAASGVPGPDPVVENGALRPVGLAYVALARESGSRCEEFQFPLDRPRHRQITAHTAIDWVRRALLDAPIVGPSLLRRRGGGPPPASG